ncbi:MAG: ABATE domain-containing protein, partial [Mycobacterium sp.]
MDVYATGADDEAFLLDLLNTTPVIDGVPTDALADVAAAAPWMTAYGIPATAAAWTALTDARAAVQAVVRGDQPAVTLQ